MKKATNYLDLWYTERLFFFKKYNFKMSYIRFCMLVLDFKKLHGTDHGLHGHKDVLKDQLNETSPIFFCISRAMNDAHLFDKGRLAGLSGP